MAEQTLVDVKSLLLEEGPIEAAHVEQVHHALNSDAAGATRLLREAVAQLEKQLAASSGTESRHLRTRLGVAYYLLGHNNKAIEHLTGQDKDPVAGFYLGKALLAQRQFAEADRAFQQAARAGFEDLMCTLMRVEALRGGGQLDQAEKLLASVPKEAANEAEFLYQKGACLVARGDDAAARPFLEKAVGRDSTHIGALFALAYANDLLGNDAEAVDLYERIVALRPLNVGALINLGVLYEDMHQYDKAAACYQQVLDAYPNHPRARLFLKDARASRHMYYDEEAARKYDRLAQLMKIPVTDFELSVRSRNCLGRMGIHTLGDLTRTTEQQLLGSKNFGETSLQEIKEMLESKGLRLGQALEEFPLPELFEESPELSPQQQVLLNKPIAELSLSVRARKCMAKLNIATVGDLLQRTGDELLDCKNFGVTSLNEVREKLTTLGLKLKGD